MKDRQIFGIYDKDTTLPVFFGTNTECGKYLGISPFSFCRLYSKIRTGKIKSTHGYLIEEVCKESDMED